MMHLLTETNGEIFGGHSGQSVQPYESASISQ